MDLYERLAEEPGGAQALASARLRRDVEVALYEAAATSPSRRLKRALRKPGGVKVDVLAELLHEAGYELEIRVLPAGEQHRRAVVAGQEAAAARAMRNSQT